MANESDRNQGNPGNTPGQKDKNQDRSQDRRDPNTGTSGDRNMQGDRSSQQGGGQKPGQPGQPGQSDQRSKKPGGGLNEDDDV